MRILPELVDEQKVLCPSVEKPVRELNELTRLFNLARQSRVLAHGLRSIFKGQNFTHVCLVVPGELLRSFKSFGVLS